MKPLELEELSAAPSGAAGTSGEVSARKEAVSGSAHGIGQICRQLFGIPDYERYLAHAAARHTGAPLLSRRDFFAQAIDRKYGKSGPRCC
jgi:uncharacterized short protein YbdD (DUF466 family)